MSDYEPLELGALANASADLFAPAPSPGVGRATFRGIPFSLGSDSPGAACYVAFGDGHHTSPVRIPVGRAARTLIVAHAVVDSLVARNGPVGRRVADYIFHLEDGSTETVSIRETFEIAALPRTIEKPNNPDWLATRVAAQPFLAVSHQYESLTPRFGGPWADAGSRMTEAQRAFPTGFKLWAWRVPRDTRITALEVQPGDQFFAIGGITVGMVDEDPFVRTGREPVLIELLGGDRRTKSRSLGLRIDRGIATFVYPVAPESPSKFMAGQNPGWGEPELQSVSPGYSEVAAVPSATVEVLDGDEVMGAVMWGDIARDGTATDGQVRLTWVDRARSWVHTTVADEATGHPIPCRIHFRSPAGIPWQPHGHHSHVNSEHPSWHMDIGGDIRLGRVSYAVIDGRCQGWLPEGDVLVEVVRGFEYEPLRATVRIEPGQRELHLKLRRWIDLSAEGWVSGDTHVHFLSVAGAHLEAKAEDLRVVNLLQAQWGHLFTSAEEFTGRPALDADGETIVYVGQENRQHMLGHLGLLGLRRPVMPWSSDGPDEAEIGGTLETTLSHWADAGRAAGALITAPHFAYPNGELAALIATGRVDALEMLRQGRYFHEEYYRYLNAGYKLPLVGGTDKMTSEVPVGLYRTYARVNPNEPLTYEAWKEAVIRGRTFLSAGPILRLSVDGADIGDTLNLGVRGGTIDVEVTAESAAPMHVLQLILGGRIVAESVDQEGSRRLALSERVAVDESTWIAARAGGPGYYDGRRTLCSFERGIFAHTSPIYVSCGEGAWTRDDPATLEYMLTRVQGVLEYVSHAAPITRIGGGGHPHGTADHLAYLTQPLLEAQAAIRSRLRLPTGGDGE